MIRSFLARDGKLRAGLDRHELIGFLASPSGVLWVDLVEPTSEEMALLSEVFKFHPLAVEDAGKESDLPKADVYEGYAHIVVHRPAAELECPSDSPREMDIFLSEKYLVSVHAAASASAAEVMARVEASPALLESGPDRILYEILDRIVDRHMRLLDTYDDALDDLEEAILSGTVDDEVLEKALRLRRGMAELRRSLGPQRDLIQGLARRNIPYVSEGVAPYLRDVLDHMTRIYQSLESHRDHVASLFEAYMAVSSNRLTMAMKSLTLFATIFLPLGFMAGLYGMNFEWMPGLHHPYGFVAVLGVMGAVAVAMVFYFRRQGLW